MAPVTDRYWHANCNGIDVDFTTTGEHKPESLSIHEFPFTCPVCGKSHVALEVTQAERDVLKAQDSGDGKITKDMVERLEQETLEVLDPNDVLNADVLTYYVRDYDDLDTISTSCHWCDKDVEIGSTVYLWGEPIGDGKFLALNTLDSEECVKARLESFQAQQGKSALLIKYRG